MWGLEKRERTCWDSADIGDFLVVTGVRWLAVLDAEMWSGAVSIIVP